MTEEEKMKYVQQAAAFQLRLQRVLYALRETDGVQRHIQNLQWSCPAEVNVKAGIELTREGLIDQAIRDVDDAIAVTDLALSGEADPEPEPGGDEYDWPEDPKQSPVDAFCSVVERHIAHAIEQHPLFAHELCDRKDNYAQSAEVSQEAVKVQLNAGRVYADTLLFEEVYEFLAEVQKGDITRAKEEAGDVAAVLYRIIQMLEERQ